jgi:hypothetical protein
MSNSISGSVCVLRPSLRENDWAALSPPFFRLCGDRKDCIVAISKTAALDKQSGLTYSRVEDVLSAIGVGLAVGVNALWIGVFGYCVLSLM